MTLLPIAERELRRGQGERSAPGEAVGEDRAVGDRDMRVDRRRIDRYDAFSCVGRDDRGHSET